LTGLKIDFPGMERAYDGPAGDNAVCQRPAAMRALVFHGEESITEVEDRNILARYMYGASFAQRNVFRIRDAEPLFRLRVLFHWYTFSIGSI
jgi:hypothetical protein